MGNQEPPALTMRSGTLTPIKIQGAQSYRHGYRLQPNIASAITHNAITYSEMECLTTCTLKPKKTQITIPVPGGSASKLLCDCPIRAEAADAALLSPY